MHTHVIIKEINGHTDYKKERLFMKKYVITMMTAAVLMASVTGCGKTADNAPAGEVIEESGYRDDVSAADLKTAVTDALGEAYWPEAEIPAEFLDQSFGISAEWYDEYLGEMPMMSMKVDTLIIVKAKADSVTKVEEALNAYRETVVNDSLQYPMNVGKVQASRIETFGNYVCFVQLGGDTTAAMDSNPDNPDEAVIAHCQEQNQIALDAIEMALTDSGK